MLSTRLNKALIVLSLGVLVASASACRNAEPCPDCNDHADDEPAPDLPVQPDLPCGGADFMTDNDNCGSCGNVCNVWYVGADWEGGICVQGVCGPYWRGCFGEGGQENTCEEFCSNTGLSCVANGCSGLTAMLFDVGFDGDCGPTPNGPDGTMTGPCDEQIPWMTNIETSREVMCCCAE